MLVNILIGLSLLAVVGTFLWGMVAFARNSHEGRSLNKAMSWRVKTQLAAIAVLVLSLWAKAQGG